MKKSILFIAYDFPPILSPESIQVQRRAIALAQKGHNVHVLTACDNPDFEFIDPTLNREHENLTIHRVNKLPAEKALHYICGGLEITDRKLWWKFPAVKAALKIISEFKIENLYTHSTPLVNHLAGFEVKKVIKTIHWTAHFSDPWTMNPYISYRTGLQRKINKGLESGIISKVDKITVTSEKTRDMFVNRLKADSSKIRVLPHVFDPELYSRKESGSGKKIVAHTGNIYGLRSVIPLIEAIEQVQPKNLEFHFYGRMKDDERELAHEKCPDLIKIFDPIPYLKSIQVLSDADILLVIDAPLNNSPFFPSKLADYIGAGKPVAALTPLSSTTTDIIRKIQKDLLIADSSDVTAIAALLRRLGNTDGSTLKEGCKEFYDMNNNYEKLREALIDE
ncbi:Glycosyltransferase involved in cell wall bisynthesis [Maridesulfovibrio ferrireducens]|uniref:Glycosyltransferase involved in cell wall bisynthesis n=1 Tax=Maridesulfovibrio ferrireducens TaxID=246191 RepID=A0A1G9CQT1_9BACT|nr:glycosyltransferase family 4 protein [Maridesulfovibrio ferrireducens]SDK53969.1 Glycosyltransferase involved in cell wall bisynthesis [Maridesulfovibrio ferrireducens]